MPTAPFYEAKRRYRNARTVRTLILSGLFAFFPTIAALKGVPPSGRSGAAYYFACVIGALFWYVIVIGVRNLVSGRIDSFRIDTAGARFNERFIPWSQITGLAFSKGSFTRNGHIAISTHPTLLRAHQ